MKSKKMVSLGLCLMLLLGCAFAEYEDEGYHQYMMKKLQMVADHGVYENWTPAQREELDAFRESVGISKAPEEEIFVPEGHLSLEEALEIGRVALEQEVGLPAGSLSDAGVAPVGSPEEGFEPYSSWLLLLYPKNPELPYNYMVEVESTMGRVVNMVTEDFEQSEREDTLRLQEPGDISMEEAVEIARAHIRTSLPGHNGLKEDGFALFYAHGRLAINDEMGRIYDIHFDPMDRELVSYFGSYSVCIDPQTGLVWEGGRGNG